MIKMTESALKEILKMVANGGTYNVTTATDGTPMIIVKTSMGYTRQFLYEKN